MSIHQYMSKKSSKCIWVGNFNIFVCLCMSICNNYVPSTMVRDSSHTFRRNMFTKADTVAIYTRTNLIFHSNNESFCPHCVLSFVRKRSFNPVITYKAIFDEIVIVISLLCMSYLYFGKQNNYIHLSMRLHKYM